MLTCDLLAADDRDQSPKPMPADGHQHRSQALLAAEFEGKPIRQQNLSDWRKHGYAKWLRQREALDLVRQLADDTGELQLPRRPAARRPDGRLAHLPLSGRRPKTGR
jgi:hypothetical protein